MANLPGSGAIDNVATSDIRFGEAIVAITPPPDGARQLRFMPGLLGVLIARFLDEAALAKFMALVSRDSNPGSNDQFSSSSPTPGLASQIRGDGDLSER